MGGYGRGGKEETKNFPEGNVEENEIFRSLHLNKMETKMVAERLVISGPLDYRTVERSRSASDRLTRRFHFMASFIKLQPRVSPASNKRDSL